jgi:6-phosphogluconate dehydrogenase
MSAKQADIGLIGLAVMGQNLVMNMNDHGFTVAVFNRTVAKVDEFLSKAAKGSNVIGTKSLKEFFSALKRPRKVMLMVKAGQAVDDLIEECLPFLEKGDILIDGGNSHYPDTERRVKELEAKGILFLGTGISGGEEGARHGPSIMPGGNPQAWPHVKPIFQAIAAKADHGEPCCDWVGEGGAGHYVKMVHNGIEYGDMQIICEAYHLLSELLGYEPAHLAKTFASWNAGELNSYLIEITSNIFAFQDVDHKPLVEKVLDTAGQKGTGKWTGISALEKGVPVTLIGEAVFARCLSSLKEERVKFHQFYTNAHTTKFSGNPDKMQQAIQGALYASKIISYTQGFMLMRAAALEFGWKLNYGSIAMMWRGGCIIRSSFLSKIKEAYDKNSNLESLLFDPFFKRAIETVEAGWRQTVSQASLSGIPVPCFSTALAFFDGYRCAKLPANLLQAQRDYFGAHTYERTDKPRGTFFHTNWTGKGGDVSSSTYQV